MIRHYLLFRADGNSKIGYGHVMRLLALAEIVRSDFDICFIIKETAAWLKNQIAGQYLLLDIPPDSTVDEEIKFLSEYSPGNSHIIILDGYCFDTYYQTSLREVVGIKVVSIDDFQPFKYSADAVINHAGFLNPEQFEKEEYTKLFLGPEYALLRNDFNEAAKLPAKVNQECKTVFICSGGTRPEIFNQILNDLVRRKVTRILIVLSNTEKSEKYRSVSESVETYSDLSAKQMIELMGQSDFAVLPASTLCYEYSSVSGGLFVIKTAENQKYIYDFIIESGCGFSYEDFDSIFESPDLISKFNSQRARQRQYFSGNNVLNLQKEIFKIALFDRIELRKATTDDLMFHFHLANDEDARRNSFNPQPISLETHKLWYQAKLSNSDSSLYVLWAENLPLGNIRFDFTGENALLSYSVDRRFRNNGLGSAMLIKGIQLILKEYSGIKLINGYVNKKNIASINSFAKAGFIINNDAPKHFEDYDYYSLNITR